MKKSLLRIALSVALISEFQLFPAIADDARSLTICGTAWGKYGGDDLPGKGFVPDLVMRVFRHAGYEIETKLVPWPRCVQLTKELKFDLVSSGWRGENFAPHFDYLNVILIDTVNFITLEDSPIVSGEIENFHGKRVGHVRDSGGMDVFENQDKIEVVKAAVLKKLLYMLGGGRIDAIVSDPVNLNEAVKSLDRSFGKKLKVLQPPLQINYNSPLVSKKHPNKDRIIADFDRSYRALVAEGLYDELIGIHDLQVQYPK